MSVVLKEERSMDGVGEGTPLGVQAFIRQRTLVTALSITPITALSHEVRESAANHGVLELLRGGVSC